MAFGTPYTAFRHHCSRLPSLRLLRTHPGVRTSSKMSSAQRAERRHTLQKMLQRRYTAAAELASLFSAVSFHCASVKEDAIKLGHPSCTCSSQREEGPNTPIDGVLIAQTDASSLLKASQPVFGLSMLFCNTVMSMVILGGYRLGGPGKSCPSLHSCLKATYMLLLFSEFLLVQSRCAWEYICTA